MIERIVMYLFSLLVWKRKEKGLVTYKLCRLVQDNLRTPEGIARLRDAPEALFDEYGLTEAERKPFRKSMPLSMPMYAEAGLPPMLRLHVALATDKKIMRDMTVRNHKHLLEID